MPESGARPAGLGWGRRCWSGRCGAGTGQEQWRSAKEENGRDGQSWAAHTGKGTATSMGCPLPVLAVPSWLPQPPARGSSELSVSSLPIYSSGLFLGQAGAAGARGAGPGTTGAAGTLSHAPHPGQLPVSPPWCCALGTQGLSWHRDQLGLAGLRGIPWGLAGLARALWSSVGPHDLQQVLVGLCGAQGSSLGLHGALWSSVGSMGLSGALWGPAGLHVTPGGSMGLRGGRQVPLGCPCPSVARG